MRQQLKNWLEPPLLGLMIALLFIGLTAAWGKAMAGQGYLQHNLVSDDTSAIPADHQDTTLLNPWGVALFLGAPFWINDNGSGLSALYSGDGLGLGGSDPARAVTIPAPRPLVASRPQRRRV